MQVQLRACTFVFLSSSIQKRGGVSTLSCFDIMETTMILCVICRKRDGNEKLILFTEHTFKKSSDVLRIRKDNELKFQDVILPPAIDATHGYHPKCYKNFTALMSKYIKKVESGSEEQSTTFQASTSKENPQKQEETQSSSSSAENSVKIVKNLRNSAAVCFFFVFLR